MDERARPLHEDDLGPDPLRAFERWFEEARAVSPLPEAIALASADAAGAPSVRMVLLKRWDEHGLVFHTNYASRKGRELEANPRAAALLYWHALGRQVRVEGAVARVGREESQAYFRTRPRASRIGALASCQSEPIGSRGELDERRRKLERAYEGREVPLPESWGGYRLEPERWEFWQHREDRLHDRFLYERVAGGGWRVQRLQP